MEAACQRPGWLVHGINNVALVIALDNIFARPQHSYGPRLRLLNTDDNTCGFHMKPASSASDSKSAVSIASPYGGSIDHQTPSAPSMVSTLWTPSAAAAAVSAVGLVDL